MGKAAQIPQNVLRRRQKSSLQAPHCRVRHKSARIYWSFLSFTTRLAPPSTPLSISRLRV
jgi:hypothetical protein